MDWEVKMLELGSKFYLKIGWYGYTIGAVALFIYAIVTKNLLFAVLGFNALILADTTTIKMMAME